MAAPSLSHKRDYAGRASWLFHTKVVWKLRKDWFSHEYNRDVVYCAACGKAWSGMDIVMWR